MAPGALITAQSQIEWNQALLLGDGTDLYVSSLTGWDDLPAVDSGNVPRSQTHGSWAGRMLAQERIVTVEFDILPGTYDTAELRDRVRELTPVDPTGTEYPIVVKSDVGAPLLAYGQVTRRALPMGRSYRQRIEGCAIQWVCSDPRRYSVNEMQITVAAAAPGSGYVFPLTYPIEYGTATNPGIAYVVNDGNASSPPIIQIAGPVVTPRVVNHTTGDVLEFDITLAVEDVLTVDVGAGTVFLGSPSASRMSTLTSVSVPPSLFELPPGVSSLAFRGAEFPDPGAHMTVIWRAASW
jgi:hypothetical protein